MVWDTSPGITSATVLLRLVAAVIPVGQLWVGKLIIDQVVQRITGRSGASNRIWVLVAYEAVLAGMRQQVITLLSLSAAVVSFSPWFLVLLVIAVIPAFLGETRFAMLAYSILNPSS